MQKRLKSLLKYYGISIIVLLQSLLNWRWYYIIVLIWELNFTLSFTLTPSELFEWVSDCCLTPTQYFFSQLYHGKNTLILNEMMIEGLTVPFVVVGQPCIKRSHSKRKCRLRQVTSWKRFKSYEIFYDRTRKRWPFNTCDCLIEATGWSGLTVYYPPLLFILFQIFMVNINDKGKKGSPLWGITPPKRASALLFRRNQIYNSPYGRRVYQFLVFGEGRTPGMMTAAAAAPRGQ